MHTKFLRAAALAASCVTALNLHAGIVLQDDFSYPDGVITNVSNMKWSLHSGNPDFMVSGGAAQIAPPSTGDVNATLTSAPYAPTGSVAALYAKFTINLTALPSGAAAYFAHFKDTTTGFRARIFANTNGAASGSFRIGVSNGGSTPTNVTTDLSPNVTYTVVARYLLSSGVSTVWVDPVNEGSASATDSAGASPLSIIAFALRQSNGEGVLAVDNLVVGTSFADVVPASLGQNPPIIVSEPQNASVFADGNVTFTVNSLGDEPKTYQWYYNTNSPLTGETGQTLTLNNVGLSSSGTYSVAITNTAGYALSRFATLTVSDIPVPPQITNQPQDISVVVGGTAAFNVVAGGSPPLAYQWSFVAEGATNIMTNAIGSTLTLSNVTFDRAGSYFVTITNQFGVTNSALAVLTVTPPPATNISYLHAILDANYVPTNTTSLFTVEGIVTTHANLTTGNNGEFFLQDATAGIAVFYAGGATNLPPAGARVRVTAPLSSFNGLLELAPSAANASHSVSVISTNNPLPTARALPFDATSQNDPAIMDALEGSYVVASNVLLNATSTLFVSVSAGEQLTNQSGETFTMYVNAGTDIPGQTKPSGPVTVYGVLGQFDTTNPRTSGYQLIPSRFADIISASKAATVRATNVVANGRGGDQITNTYKESVLRPGEKLTMYVTVTDPDGGSVTITPLTAGLPTSASWTTGVTTGTNVTATFQFQPTQADAGVNYTVALRSSNASKTATNTWTVYVPTAAEQQIYISEFLANPTSDTNSPAFNPLHRTDIPTSNITVYDEYVEIVNRSATDVDLYNWTISDAVTLRHRFYNGAPVEQLGSSNAIVVYGGPLNGNTPTLPVPAFPASESSAGLALNNTGTETIILRNAAGYIVDRVFYTANDLSSTGSVSRFPTLQSDFVPQAAVGTNVTSAGTQPGGQSWSAALQEPTGVNNISAHAGNPLTLTFTAVAGQIYTLWKADDINQPFVPSISRQFPTTSGLFAITNPPPSMQFYFITTQ